MTDDYKDHVIVRSGERRGIRIESLDRPIYSNKVGSVLRDQLNFQPSIIHEIDANGKETTKRVYQTNNIEKFKNLLRKYGIPDPEPKAPVLEV